MDIEIPAEGGGPRLTIARQFHRRFIVDRGKRAGSRRKEEGERNTRRITNFFTRLALARRNFIILTEYKNPVPIVSTCSNSVREKVILMTRFVNVRTSGKKERKEGKKERRREGRKGGERDRDGGRWTRKRGGYFLSERNDPAWARGVFPFVNETLLRVR